MKAMRGMKRAMLALCLLATAPAQAADWGTFYFHNVRGSEGSWAMRLNDGRYVNAIQIDVGAGCLFLSIETGVDGHGGKGNCNLYVRSGALPDGSSYLKRSMRANYKERISIPNPPAGRYYIRMFAHKSYRCCLRVFTLDGEHVLSNRAELYRMNWERDIRGIRHLGLSSRLLQAAEWHAEDMTDYGYYSLLGRTAATRTVLQRIAATGYRARAGGENIAIFNRNPEQIISAWMRIATSRANILKPTLRHVGMGYSANRCVAVFAEPR